MVYAIPTMKHYTLEKKPKFKMNEHVTVDMERLGCPTLGFLPGRIVGKAFEHVLDFWLVEFNRDFSPTYPYKVMSIPHVAILDFE